MKTPPQKKATANRISPDIIAALKAHLKIQRTQASLAAQIGVSTTQLSRALSEDGDFHYSVRDFEAKVLAYLDAQTRQRSTDEPLVSSGFLVQAMDDFLTTVRSTLDIGVAWSQAGLGKTSGIHLYKARDPLCILVTALKSQCGWRALRDSIKAALPQPRKLKTETWDAFIQRTFRGSKRLLIVDNAHLLTESARQWLAYDWHEETGCPLALVGNEAIRDQWSRNDQHQSRVGIAQEVAPAQDVTATATARQMLALHMPDHQAEAELIKLSTAVVKSQGSCRWLKKHLKLTTELLSSGAYPATSAAFRAAHQLLLRRPDFRLDDAA